MSRIPGMTYIFDDLYFWDDRNRMIYMLGMSSIFEIVLHYLAYPVFLSSQTLHMISSGVDNK